MRDDLRFTFSVPPKEKDVIATINSYTKRYGDNRSKAIRQIVKDKISLEQEHKRLGDENKQQKEYISYLNDVKKSLNPKYPQCKHQYLIENDPTKRECTLNNSDRGFNLPKVHGKFIVDSAKKCERCIAGEYKKSRKRGSSRKHNNSTQKSSVENVIEWRICPMDGEKKHAANCEICKIRTRDIWVKCQKMRLNIH